MLGASSVRSRRTLLKPSRRTSPGARIRGWSDETDQRNKGDHAAQSSLCLFIALSATKLGQACAAESEGADFSAKAAAACMEALRRRVSIGAHAQLSPHSTCAWALQPPSLFALAVYVKGKNAKKYRKNVEYGSARWGNSRGYTRPTSIPMFENNIILTQTERLTMNSRPKDPKTARNKNVLVVGGSGSRQDALFHQAKSHAVYLRRPAGFLRRHRPERQH